MNRAGQGWKRRLVVWLWIGLNVLGLLILALPEAVESRVIKGEVATAWVNRYRWPDEDMWLNKYVCALAVDSQGNVYVTGGLWHDWTYDSWFVTLKLNSSGQVLWVRRYQGQYFANGAAAMALDRQGNVYVTGSSGIKEDDGSEWVVMTTFKFDPDGRLIWSKSYEGDPQKNSSYVANAMALDDQENIFITGPMTIKYSPDGQELWARDFARDFVGSRYANAIGVDGKGNVYVTGSSAGSRLPDYRTIKYSPDGTAIWEKRYNGPGKSNDRPQAITIDGQGNVYVTGTSTIAKTSSNCATIKYSPDGRQLWVRRVEVDVGYGWRRPVNALDPEGNIYVTVNTSSKSITTVKYNPEGQKLWIRRHSGPRGERRASAMTVDRKGNVYVTGTEWHRGSWSNSLTIKYDTDGRRIWLRRYQGPPNVSDGAFASASAVALDGQGGVYIGGTSTGYENHQPKQYFLTIKYLQNP